MRDHRRGWRGGTWSRRTAARRGRRRSTAPGCSRRSSRLDRIRRAGVGDRLNVAGSCPLLAPRPWLVLRGGGDIAHHSSLRHARPAADTAAPLPDRYRSSRFILLSSAWKRGWARSGVNRNDPLMPYTPPARSSTAAPAVDGPLVLAEAGVDVGQVVRHHVALRACCSSCARPRARALAAPSGRTPRRAAPGTACSRARATRPSRSSSSPSSGLPATDRPTRGRVADGKRGSIRSTAAPPRGLVVSARPTGVVPGRTSDGGERIELARAPL